MCAPSTSAEAFEQSNGAEKCEKSESKTGRLLESESSSHFTPSAQAFRRAVWVRDGGAGREPLGVVPS